jgi:hypothetical protein
MKITHVKNEDQKNEYPCLMEGALETIVIMSGEHNGRGMGIVLKHETEKAKFYYSNWDMSKFKPLPKGEQIILEN